MSKETTDQIVRALVEERDRISRAIEALTETVKRRGRPPKDPLSPPSPSKKK